VLVDLLVIESHRENPFEHGGRELGRDETVSKL
jgi:hypothetical protein